MTNTLRLTVTADVHCHDWTTFSQIGTDGRPSRLMQYLTLAEDIYRHAEQNNSDAIVIAGDLVESSVMRPMVIDVLNEFIDILSDFPLYITHGNHDLDAKKAEIAPFHSVLTHLKDRQNVNYADHPIVYKINGYRLLVCPWGEEIPDIQADIFVGHGIVRGVTNHEGHLFRSGFTVEDLWSRFRVSIIGDIHNGQALDGGGRLVLIPGMPLQNSWRDSPVTGLWNILIDPDNVTWKFTSIHDIRPDYYHQFLFTDNPEQNSTSRVHYRYREPKEAISKTKEKGKTLTRDRNISSIASEIIDQAKIENKDKIKEMMSSVISALDSSDRKIPRTKIKSIRVHNFLSIGDFELDLNEFFDNLVVIGDTGVGKTALFEALFWALTGNNTRGIAAANIVNEYASDGAAWVEVAIEVEETLYQIRRERNPEGPSLVLRVWDSRESAFIDQDRGSVARTQSMITQMVGLSASEILLLSYFSAKEPVLFGTLGSTEKNNLMAMISGSSEINSLRTVFSDKLSDTERSLIGAKSKIETLNSNTSYLQNEIQKLLHKTSENNDSEISKLIELRGELEKIKFATSDEELHEDLLYVSSKLNQATRQSYDLEKEIQLLTSQRVRMLETISKMKGQVKTAMQGKCPTCGQTLHDEELIAKLSDEIYEMTSKLPDEKMLSENAAKLSEIYAKMEEWSAKKSENEKMLASMREHDRRLKATKERIAELQKDQTDHSAVIRAHQQSIEINSAEISGIQALVSQTQIEYNFCKWIYGTLLKRNGPLVQVLNSRTKELLQQQIEMLTAGGTFKVRVEDDLSISGSFFDRNFRNYKELSMGQQRILDVIMLISLNNLFSQIYAMEEGVLGLVIFDEVFSFLDEKYADSAFEFLNRVNVGKRIVISHDFNLVNKFDYKLLVSLSGRGSSAYRKSWQ